MGNALLDRIDIRVPVKPVGIEEMVGEEGERSGEVKARVQNAITIQSLY